MEERNSETQVENKKQSMVLYGYGILYHLTVLFVVSSTLVFEFEHVSSICSLLAPMLKKHWANKPYYFVDFFTSQMFAVISSKHKGFWGVNYSFD